MPAGLVNVLPQVGLREGVCVFVLRIAFSLHLAFGLILFYLGFDC